MKIILRTDVENLGKIGDLVEVRAGYGRNYLLPHGLAMLATPANIKIFELERKKLLAQTEAMRSEAADIATKIEKAVVNIAMRVGENDKLYGSVTSIMIVDALLEQGIEVDRRRLLLDAPLRTLGTFPIRVRLHADVVAELNVNIVPERTIHGEEEATPVAETEPVAKSVEATSETETQE